MVLSPYYIDEEFVNDFQSVFTGYNALLGKFAFGLNLNNIKIVFISIFFSPQMPFRRESCEAYTSIHSCHRSWIFICNYNRSRHSRRVQLYYCKYYLSILFLMFLPIPHSCLLIFRLYMLRVIIEIFFFMR